MTIRVLSSNVTVSFSIINNLGHATTLPMNVDDWSTFVGFLRSESKRRIEKKEDTFLLCPSLFRTTDRRRREDVISASFLCFDNDGGGVSFKDFEKYLPRLEMVVANTFSSTNKHPRWRAFIPLSRAVYSEEYSRITRGIIEHVAGECGLKSKETGFDLTKLNAESVFYLPSKSEEPGGSFFRHQCREPRKPLNADQWLGWFPMAPMPPASKLLISPDREQGVDAAVGLWRTAGVGEGNAAFFRLALGLKASGLSLDGIEALLFVEANNGRTPPERRRQIPSILNSLKSPK